MPKLLQIVSQPIVHICTSKLGLKLIIFLQGDFYGEKNRVKKKAILGKLEFAPYQTLQRPTSLSKLIHLIDLISIVY
jgi:hypothetical protein